MKNWPLQDAKARLSELIKQAQADGPQEITVRGEPAVIVMAKKDYDTLVRPKPDLVAFLRNSPLAGMPLDLERDGSPPRDVDL
ncbi:MULTISPECIES: type II toxin-antitoxin system Phd/YefM family antitoxin [Rhodomicrobium]|uniref:type II toxin-antitoxin system Phd/YefM family antitoxin n=1 Tax=Rhodomicrobium TaxID=1068 RepID=UPI000B4ABE64|nr:MULTISPECIES: type II toxin-antitoxin system Phd/YefM family antitoxin [Rhodomicrobium]